MEKGKQNTTLHFSKRLENWQVFSDCWSLGNLSELGAVGQGHVAVALINYQCLSWYVAPACDDMRDRRSGAA